MNGFLSRYLPGTAVLLAVLAVAGCATVYENTRGYLGTPVYAPTNPATVQILPAEPKEPKALLGEIILTVDGRPAREKIETKLRAGAARLGADAVFIVSDKMHIFPFVYYDWWWGPMGVSESMQRNIVAVAIKYKK